MDQIGSYVIYFIMICAVIGAIAAIRNSDEGLGKEFMEGLHSTGYIFVPAAGIMASIPYISWFIDKVCGPIFNKIGADPALAATAILASDMGGYQLANVLKSSYEGWIMAMIVGFMAGATIVFSIPMGLAMLDKRDHKYMALGVMSGILTVPIGAFITSAILVMTNTKVRETISTDAESTYAFAIGYGKILINLSPILVFVVAIALGLRFLPDLMIKAFMIFGKTMDAGIKLVLVFSIVEYFTGVFSKVFGSWGFDPIIADPTDQFRALETAGYIGIMLAGAFPMVYMLRKYAAKPLQAMGNRMGLSPTGSAGLLATIANILAMFRLVRSMPPKDKVINIAFGVCAAFLLGDHLSFSANFQPTIILPLIIGKFGAGVIAIGLAYWLSVPKALELEKQDREKGIIGPTEYLEGQKEAAAAKDVAAS
ncbi:MULTISPECIES: ethanolamine utilization protein EutH [Brevibacillus]|jgi:ethanolamine transporter|uniref:Ethanolamine utilization protein EutH n=1 Tax=Brevibacillus borstelensis AK1 TaxID=1300222 RepID=M8DE78_9BACL|nr:ethanolamine utilization protein EutH [Brevibacillus borstelensis]EMT51702.1 ethanolamine utilization protein EutH [Brevibacillus borstelensis AK1]KKX56203.1 ethanolamine utilization protein EutH [Brevibacillus borstelensis cifa_chp40]MBE5397263.1 ethanolamine utilization protein EutH [Brevibacillus borstelensis]MCC0566697.1 ethanolamine utilization protein EutH [Brevibacillus borstelensis]MCM3470555.1 ethanolamine utilization protein EutH [Brevibacillus borstelensis]